MIGAAVVPDMAARDSRHRRTESLDRRPAAYRGEQVTLRNRDDRTGYGLTLRVTRPDGDHVDRRDVYLGAGTTTRLFDVCDPGPVCLMVAHAGRPADAVEARLDGSQDGSVLVECGRGVVAATVEGR